MHPETLRAEAPRPGTLRIATFNADLTRDGPGLALRDIAGGSDTQVRAVLDILIAAQADVLLLTNLDWDGDGAALAALRAGLAERGLAYAATFAPRPNTGLRTGLDLDGDGRLNGPGDAQGWGRFAGEGGMAILSRLPLDTAAARDFSGFLWRDLPGGLLAPATLPAEALALQRLSSTGHWDVPVTLPGGARLHLLAFHATPPAFDGPGDRNGRRNHDEAAFWLRLLDGALPFPAPEGPFVLLGDANLDPAAGEGRAAALTALLSDPRLTDPGPQGAEGTATADWRDKGLGLRRVDYVLPAASLAVTGSGVLWPPATDPLAPSASAASAHRLVWVDITLP